MARVTIAFRLSGLVIFGACVLVMTSAALKAAPVPICYGCQCISPAECDGCVEVYNYYTPPSPKAGQKVNAGAVWVKLSGTAYRTCYAGSPDTDCSTFELACWASGAGALPNTYDKAGCNKADSVILFLVVNSDLEARRTGCGQGASTSSQ